VNSLLPLLSLHNHHHQLLTPFAGIITSPETPFDEAKIALERWQDLGRGGQRWEGVREWEELVELELAGFGREKEREEDEGIKGRRKGRKG
jgi:hypothetical protein